MNYGDIVRFRTLRDVRGPVTLAWRLAPHRLAVAIVLGFEPDHDNAPESEYVDVEREICRLADAIRAFDAAHPEGVHDGR